MRVLSRPLSGRSLLAVVLTAVLIAALPAPGAAADPRLERAQERRIEVQRELDALYQRLAALSAEAEALAGELATLEAQGEAQQQEAVQANSALAVRIRESYVRGNPDPTITLLTTGTAESALEQARMLGLLALRSRADYETAAAAQTRTEATASEVEHKHEALSERQAEIQAVQRDVSATLAEAQAEEDRVRAVIAREERERREREERERREQEERERRAVAERQAQTRDRASRSNTAGTTSSAPAGGTSGGQQPAAAPSGGIACPVGQPRSYSDTWGAPRSGGRSHQGTDILAPRGTPIYAYEDGTITRMNSNRLGGISLYLRGNSGNLYYYTHLQGYVSGLSPGQQVSAGQHIAFNGDTGNARGIPHLHFEVMPGGGGKVNPYPYVARACG